MSDAHLPTVAVTGASGFVGTHLCAYLAARGHRVIALHRNAEGPAAQHAIMVRTWQGLEVPLDPRMVRGADVLVHLAGRAHVMRERGPHVLARYRHANVDGTRRVIDAAHDAGIARFIHVSTIKVLGEGRPHALAEDDPYEPQGAYAESKVEAEQLVRASGMPDWVVVRPPLVYGPGVKANFRRLLALAYLGRRIPLPLGGIVNRRSFVSVANLSSALRLVATVPGPLRDTFHVTDGEDLGTSDLLGRLIVDMGGTPRLFPAPGMARAGTGGSRRLARLLGTLMVDSSRIRTRLGWQPPQSLDAALDETARWYLGQRR